MNLPQALCAAFLLLFLFSSELSAQEDRVRRQGSRDLEREEEDASQTRNQGPDTGILRGSVIDGETGESLIGATILLPEAQKGANSDLDGKFEIRGIQPGTYQVKVSYVGLQTQTFDAVSIQAGEVTRLEVKLLPEITETPAIVIETRAITNSEASMLTEQRQSAVVLNGISSAEVSRNGDSNAASAIRRVAGITVEDGRYMYVRGLGDRYSKVMLNGAVVPSLDPERNAVQMDLFPANLIQSMVVYKTFSPNMPGDFSGGLLDIRLHDFPDEFTLNFSSSVGYNTNATFNDDFLTYEGGNLDWLGMDDGTRARPDALQENNNEVPEVSSTFTDLERSRLLSNITKGFSETMTPSTRTAPVNHSHSFSIGDQVALFGRPLGYIFSLSYRRSFQYYDEGRVARWRLLGDVSTTDQLNPAFNLEDTRGSEQVLWGAMGTVSYKPADNTKIALRAMSNQAGNDFARYQIGAFPDDDPNLTRENRVLGFTERNLNSFQLQGEHVIPALNKLDISWVSSYTIATQEEPDLRFFTNDFTVSEPGDTVYDIQLNLYNPPSRFYRSYDEYTFDNRLHATLPIDISDRKMKLRLGGSYTQRGREFREDRYLYGINPELTPLEGNLADIFQTEFVGLADPNTAGTYTLWIEDGTDENNNYNGLEQVIGAYALADVPITRRFRAIIGGRMETTDIFVETERSIGGNKVEGNVEQLDFLPSANLVYTVAERMNLRLGYTRTIARPTFREVAPFSSFNFIGDFLLVGNPDNLDRTLAQNVDLRWEWFPGINEIVSVSLFWKDFEKPIERVLNPLATNPEIQFRNVDNATNFGVEFELRKNLAFIGEPFRHFQIGANLTLVESRVDIAPDELEQIRATNPDADDTRPMFSQSPYVVNGRFGYVNQDLGTNLNVVYNVFGPRIAAVTLGGTPNVYEQPRPSLDVIFTQQLTKSIGIRLRAQNLLDPEYRLIHEFKGEEYVFSNWRIGRTFTLGVSYAIN